MQFSLVSYLDRQAADNVRAIQEELSRITGSKAALSHWQPHVTIGDGIIVEDQQRNSIETALAVIAGKQKTFSITLHGIDGIDNWVDGAAGPSTPYVIWVNVIPNDTLLSLVEEVKTSVTNGLECWYKMPEPYTPHVTLAFRDLSKEGYEAGLKYLKDTPIELTSTLDHLALVERQPDGDVEYRRFGLNRS